MIKEILANSHKRRLINEAKASKNDSSSFYKFCPNCAKKNLIPNSLLESKVVCGNCQSDLTDEPLNEKFVKVVRDGEVVKKKVRTRKKILTAKQKQALRKARKKAHTSSAKRKRAKSIKKGQRLGLNDSKSYMGEDGVKYVVCPNCQAHNSLPENINEATSKIMCGECKTVLNEAKSGVQGVLDQLKNDWAKLSSGSVPSYITTALSDLHKSLSDSGSKLAKIKPIKGKGEDVWAKYDSSEINKLYKSMDSSDANEKDYATLMFKVYSAYVLKTEGWATGEDSGYKFTDIDSQNPNSLDKVCEDIEDAYSEE